MMHWHSWPFSDFYGMSNQLPWPSKPKPTRRKTTMSRTFKYNILVDTMHVFDGFIVSSSVARDTSFYLHPSLSLQRTPAPLPELHLPTWNLSMSMVVFSFCLVPPKKNRWKWAQSAPKSPSCLSISHTCHLTHTDTIPPSLTLPLYLWLVWLSLLWPRTWMTFHNFIKVCTMQRGRWQAKGRIGGDSTKIERKGEKDRG